ncbi:DUF883 C-terminal domain-containing protein [Simiduia curdlanivorans]|uniref:DUF883 domain-containing protein n=1 Tax=Simiduia curdlanivorans TaxID=1492769 RepID=A0ABV8V4P5_9GAMM|nr:DUF883 C-terminal domain-containing protein [Simiduia curdlanivorans]MDN3641058.1 DUF883 C-terminal domain-containing protein [Simiduia curdlanivorans]
MATSKATASSSNGSFGSPVADVAREQGHNAVDKLADQAAIAEQKVRSTAASSSETIGEKTEQAKKVANKAAADVQDFAKNNPWTTAGIAFATGALVSAFLRRK